MDLKFYISAFLLTSILGCTSESNKVDVKGDSINFIKDSTIVNSRDKMALIDNEIAEENEVFRIMENYGTFIRKYSKRYGFDWRLILAVIKKESRFSMQAESRRGALGLMQIMPQTGKTLAEELNLEEVISPRNNIAAGIYYLWKLSDNFEFADDENRIKLALAAYNCGLGRILDARNIVRFQNGNPNDWNSVSESLKLLSDHNSELHKSIWEENRPASGYFSDWEQPVSYVNSIFKYFNDFKNKLTKN